MTTFTITMKAESLLARLAGTHERLMKELKVTVQRLAIKAQGNVKEGKLTGQVLHVRTGTLRRSINQKVFETETGVFAQVGTNVKYAAIHEYGFDGVERVSAHVRRSALQMAGKRSSRPRKSDGTVNVRAHDRHMHMPKRSFLISTLQDMKGEIQASLKSIILQAVRP